MSMKFKKIKQKICIVMAAIIIFMAPVCSYQEAQAAELASAWALETIMMDLLSSASMSFLGYTGSKVSTAKKTIINALKKSDKISMVLSELADIQSGKKDVSDSNVFTSSYGYKYANNYKSSHSISISLTKSLIQEAVSTVKGYLASTDNDIDVTESEDLAGEETVNQEYCTSIKTSYKSLPAIDSMSGIDSLTGIEGCYDYLKAAGYTASDYYFLVYVAGSATYITPILKGYSVVGYKTGYLGSTGVKVISNANYKASITQCGVRDSQSFYQWFLALSEYSGKYYVYNHSKSSWTVNSGSYLPSYNYLSGSSGIKNWYTCNYINAYKNSGATISYNYFASVLNRIIWTYKTVGKNITYDQSTAISIPDEVTYEIPEDKADGLTSDDTDIDALLDYVNSLSAELSEWKKEQSKNSQEIIDQNNTLIGQNESMLDAMNSVDSSTANIYQQLIKTHALIGTFDIAGIAAACITTIPNLIKALPQSVADAFTVALPQLLKDVLVSVFPAADVVFAHILGIPGAEELTDILTDVFPWAKTLDDTLDVFPDAIANAVAIAIPDFPEITIPDITIPDITIPDITIPDSAISVYPSITLDPTYDITVANDYSGLADVLTPTLTAVLTDVFVPDEVLIEDEVDEMKEYFVFIDEIKPKVGFFADEILGITPSPYLKIPLGKTEGKYDYGIGNVWVIDCSWYYKYKDYGDKIILCLFWLAFFWQLFIKIPGIISGVDASVSGVYSSWYSALDKKGPKRIEGKKG